MNLFWSPSFLTKYKKCRKLVYHMQAGDLCKELEKMVAEAQKFAVLLSRVGEKSLIARYDNELERIKLILLMKNQAEWQQNPTSFEQALFILCLASRKNLAKLRKDFRSFLFKAKIKSFFA